MQNFIRALVFRYINNKGCLPLGSRRNSGWVVSAQLSHPCLPLECWSSSSSSRSSLHAPAHAPLRGNPESSSYQIPAMQENAMELTTLSFDPKQSWQLWTFGIDFSISLCCSLSPFQIKTHNRNAPGVGPWHSALRCYLRCLNPISACRLKVQLPSLFFFLLLANISAMAADPGSILAQP